MNRNLRNSIRLITVAACTLAAAFCWGQKPPVPHDGDTIVFVCEHGSVKSLIAASLFERAARERRLDVRAVSRGVHPDERVPPKIVNDLEGDGFDVAQYVPQPLGAEETAAAARVITIGVQLPEGLARDVEAWDDVPPASVDYAAARAALQRHIDSLLDELKSGAGDAPGPNETAPEPDARRR
jgi:arsenate reductase